MRPNKPINPGAHRSGTADRTSKGRHFTTGLPAAPVEATETTPPAAADPVPAPPRESKYVGRASVGPHDHFGDGTAEDPAQEDWIDPLDQDDYDLTDVTIDLRSAMIDEPPDTYFQRFSSRVPGHQ